jgi:transposase
MAMSLQPQEIAPVPEETERIARAAFPKGNIYLRLRDEIGTIFDDPMFAPLFPARGQPAECPWQLALITVMQFIEGLSDCQAADAVRSRIDWKYALGLELTDPGGDASVLCEFRARLIAGGLEQALLEAMLARFKERGLLKARGQQRTDSTHVLAAVRTLNRLESIGETLRAALNSLATVAPAWLADLVAPDWFERYA